MSVPLLIRGTVVVSTLAYGETARRVGGGAADVFAPVTPVAPERLEGAKLLMLFLHPSPDGQALCNDAGQRVLDIDTLRQCRLGGTVVFLGACYGHENTAILEALREAGARAVVAGPGVNVGGIDGFAGADVLAATFRASLEMLPVRLAWAVARGYTRLAQARGVAGAEDALEYTLTMWDEERFRARVTAALTGVISLVLMLWTLFFGSLDMPKLTFFSSILPPPSVDRWEKMMLVDGVSVPLDSSVDLMAGQSVVVSDWITPSSSISFTLVEQWDTSVLTLTDWVTATGGSIITGTGSLTWTVTSSLTASYGLTKTWTVGTGWATSAITEELTTSSSSIMSIPLIGVTPTATPTNTPTNTPTATPTLTPTPYVPQPWVETPYPTATPCVGFGCDAGASTIAYVQYLPLAFKESSAP